MFKRAKKDVSSFFTFHNLRKALIMVLHNTAKSIANKKNITIQYIDQITTTLANFCMGRKSNT